MTAAPRQGSDTRGYGLYVHLPFCASLCEYCHFVRTDRHDVALRRRLTDGLLAELELRRRACGVLARRERPLRTVYVGGGTPSRLEPALLARLLRGLLGDPVSDQDARPVEVTVEANPESFDEDTATAWRAAGVDRVSLGVQSLDRRILDLLGRRCAPERARLALRLACAVFPRVSADWILAPGVRAEALAAELREAVAAGVEHISLYILELHPGTPLAEAVAEGRAAAPDPAETERTYLAAVDVLADLGLRHYEVSNFARPGAESRHNAAYWRRRPYLGLGPGAHGFWGRRRHANHASVERYLAAVESGRLPEASAESLNLTARRLEALFLGLRTRQGVPLADLPAGALDLDAGRRAGWWRCEGGRLVPTARGWLHLDDIEDRLAVGPG